MITKELISPKNIAIIGGSDDTSKPGGNVIANLKKRGYKGEIHIVNPKSNIVQGIKTLSSVDLLPEVDCAILAIPAKLCISAVETLCVKKGCKAIIIFSAGFSENGEEGAEYERQILEIVNDNGASLIGPNCIGMITPYYAGVFTQPVSNISPDGVDIISSSGATVVFIMEAAAAHGLNFSHVFSVGNGTQIGIEEALEYLDKTYIHGESSPIKLLYIESIKNPQKLLNHARSLINKGARIAAIKAGYSDAGSRAASSHTGALASPDLAVSALFRKAGIIRVYSRQELVNMAALLNFGAPKGNKIAIITHAGGPAVMLTDILNSNGVDIPKISGEKAEKLLAKLYPGSSVSNPIDFLATGTAEQLGEIIDACNNDFDIDAMAVIFGSPGLGDVSDVYNLLLERIKSSKKPIYPILPSVVNAKSGIDMYQSAGGISFNEEAAFGKAFVDMINTPPPAEIEEPFPIDKEIVREVINNSPDGYLKPVQVQRVLDAAGISRAKEFVADNLEDVLKAVREVGFPVVMKVIGPIHKSDVGGVVLDIRDNTTLQVEFDRMMRIEEATSVLIQPMLSGKEIFIGIKREGDYGAIIMCGLGGIFVEMLKDISVELAPINSKQAVQMITNLKSFRMIEGYRGSEGVNQRLFAQNIMRISALADSFPEIMEMDINPLLGNMDSLTAIDARILIKKVINK